MKTVFDKSTREELANRVQGLHAGSAAQWGRMNAYQMLKHCALAHEMILHNHTYPRAFMGRLLGRILLKKEVKDDRPMRQGNPTIPALQVHETTGNFEAKKAKWMDLIHDYARYALPDNSFGKLSQAHGKRPALVMVAPGGGKPFRKGWCRKYDWPGTRTGASLNGQFFGQGL